MLHFLIFLDSYFIDMVYKLCRTGKGDRSTVKNKNIITLMTAGALLASPVLVHAETDQDKLNRIQSELQGNQEELQNKQQEKGQIEQDIQALQQKLDELNTAITTNQKELSDTQEAIRKTEEEITRKKEHIAYLQVQIEKRQEVIKQRLQTVQEQPRINLITEVLINAKNLAELLENLYSINLILNSDNDIVKEQVRDQKAVEKETLAVEAKERDLKDYEAKLTAKKQELDINKQQEQQILDELSAKLAQTNAEIESAEEVASLLEAQRQAVQANIAAAERAKQEAIRQQEAAKNNNGTVSAPSPSKPVAPPASNTGGFIKPAAGAFTSGFGPRVVNGKPGFHYGVDIAQGGHVPVVAAAGGIVIKAHYSSSYGNVVYMTHNISGKQYTTVYAHLASMNVSTGQTVSQGQQIGVMGNTGQSYGQHLHFELHVGAWNAAKSNAVNPVPYLR